MSSRAPRKDTHSAWFDIAVFAVVAAFFSFSARSLLLSRPRNVASATEAAAQLSDRKLASTSRPGPRPASEDRSVHVFRIGCLFGPSPAPLSTRAGMARIVANICEPKKGIGKNPALSGKNLSSGEDIVPFVQDGKTISTNYFSLREGSNKIAFQLASGKEKPLTQELELTRAPQEQQ